MLYEIQRERLADLYTGDKTQEGYDKLQDKINNNQLVYTWSNKRNKKYYIRSEYNMFS